jgi:hypothetical protein
MSRSEKPRAHLKSLPGYRRVTTTYAGVQVAVAREEDPPFAVDGVVLEEDTWLALSAPADTVSVPGHPVEVMTRVWAAEPHTAGTVVLQPGNPMRLLAIVHNLDLEPSWSEAHVADALSAAFETARAHGLRALRIPLLATRYGNLEPGHFTRLLAAQLDRQAGRPDAVRAVWLVREAENGAELLQALDR